MGTKLFAVLSGDLTTLGGLLDRQRDPTTVQVDVDDLHPQLLAGGHDLLGCLDVVGGHLGDVHQPFDALAHLDERAERDQLGDAAVYQLADLVTTGELLPRVLLGGLEREGDPLAGEVDIKHLDADLLAHLDHRAGMVHMLPAQLGDVHQSVHAAEVDERPEVHDRRDGTCAHLARLEVGEELVPLLALGLLEVGPTRQHDVVAILVELDDLGLEGLADERSQVPDAPQVDERRRKKAS